MPQKNKNNTVKFRDFLIQAMDPYMIIADFETNKLNQIKTSLFAMFTHCILNGNSNKLTHYSCKDWLNEFFNDLTYHVNRIKKIKAKRNSSFKSHVYKTNA